MNISRRLDISILLALTTILSLSLVQAVQIKHLIKQTQTEMNLAQTNTNA